MEHEPEYVGTVAHNGSSITSWRTTDGAALHPDGRLLVTGQEALLAERLKAWVRAGLMSEEDYRQRILDNAEITSLKVLNRLHRRKLGSSKATHDHVVVVEPSAIKTLHDINAAHRRRFS
jgi:hypothetical protein